jgi:PAS domain S-box-containing protein
MSPDMIIKEMYSLFSLLDHSPAGQFVVDDEFSLLFWNATMEEWTGFARTDVLGKSLLTLYPDLNTPKYRKRIETLFSDGAPIIFSSQLHRTLIHAKLPNGTERIQHTIITGFKPHGGGNYYAIFSLQDVTSLTEAISAQHQSNRQLQLEIDERKRVEMKLEKTVTELHQALSEIKTLQGIIPICSSCKKIRDDEGFWNQIDLYINKFTSAEVSHGICPDCCKKLYPEIYERKFRHKTEGPASS